MLQDGLRGLSEVWLLFVFNCCLGFGCRTCQDQMAARKFVGLGMNYGLNIRDFRGIYRGNHRFPSFPSAGMEQPIIYSIPQFQDGSLA